MEEKPEKSTEKPPSNATDTSSFSSILASVAKMRQEAGVEPVEGHTKEMTNRPIKDHRPTFQPTSKVMGEQANRKLPAQVIFRGQSGKEASYEATKHVNLRKQTFSSIQVNKNQNGNPLISSLTDVSYQFNGRIHDVDYLVNSHCFVVFLSVKYHKLHPEYIYHRIKKIGYNPNNKNMLRILLALVDVDNAADSMRELNKLCVFNHLTLIAAWSFEQCADYLTTLKQCEMNAGKTLIQGNLKRIDDMSDDSNYYERVVEVLTSIRSINKTDAVNLVARFGSFRGLCEQANEANLQEVPGMGKHKIEVLSKVIREAFVYTNEDETQ
ncbi:hypothetical protein FOA43_001987 [Brettanomyces nanus]|uniref:ERCC1-like central domain-containing protein n=1 Tax=Eeniella nana TaxID=13502 RepID=A0A875S2T3_EENNA|nr:uncharacterized protein FOA43_001987 [Brettanomyces nanus]QPG74655.1 hypothetical protein FOA43_001987 [Brettanomyces nanus]